MAQPKNPSKDKMYSARLNKPMPHATPRLTSMLPTFTPNLWPLWDWLPQICVFLTKILVGLQIVVRVLQMDLASLYAPFGCIEGIVCSFSVHSGWELRKTFWGDEKVGFHQKVF